MYPGPTGVKLFGFYVYWWEYEDSEGVTRDCAVCFKAPGRVDGSAWVELIEEISTGPELPDSVLLLYVGEDGSEFEAGRQDPAVAAGLARFEDRILCFECSIQLSGGAATIKRLGKLATLSDLEEWEKRIRSSLNEILHVGLQKVFTPDQVILEAPPGFEFVKHDQQKRSRLFLRAEQALTDTAVVSFVALCVWIRVIDYFQGRVPTIRVVYVDTMGISPVAFALREFFAVTRSNVTPQIESFHSYGGIEKVRFGSKTEVLLLISASTSMDMHRRWVEQRGLEPHQVVTLLTRRGAADSKYALVQLPLSPVGQQDRQPYSIRIKGETFLPDLEGPKPVVLGLKHSLFDRDSRFVKDARAQKSLYKEKSLLVFGSATESNPTYKTIFVDSLQLAASDQVRGELIRACEDHGFAKAGWVIHQSDPGSELLGEFLRDYFGLGAQRTVDASKVSAIASFGDDRVVVVAATLGQGSQFSSISRDLRGRHKGNRLYFSAVHLPTSFSSRDMLVRNLEKSKPGEGVYRVFSYCSLPIGLTGAAAFMAERAIYAEFPAAGWPTVLIRRAEALNRNRLSARDFGLLPTGEDLNQMLILREGYTFWDGAYEEGPWGAAVLWSIGATLQRAREDTTLSLQQQLRSTTLGQVFLDPENFTRFNDGVIQAALMRMALAHEIDYRSNDDASDRMRRFLSRLFRRLTDRSSEAILEFLMAIAADRLRLRPADLEQLVDRAIELVEAQPNTAMKDGVLAHLRVICTKNEIGPPTYRLNPQPF